MAETGCQKDPPVIPVHAGEKAMEPVSVSQQARRVINLPRIEVVEAKASPVALAGGAALNCRSCAASFTLLRKQVIEPGFQAPCGGIHPMAAARLRLQM